MRRSLVLCFGLVALAGCESGKITEAGSTGGSTSTASTSVGTSGGATSSGASTGDSTTGFLGTTSGDITMSSAGTTSGHATTSSNGAGTTGGHATASSSSAGTTSGHATASSTSVGTTGGSATTSGTTSSGGWGTVATDAFYVAPDGDDHNPGTLASPFQTLPQALSAMRGSATKTTYLRTGTYFLTSTLELQAADNGETWSTYPLDPVDSAILDGTNLPNPTVDNAYLILIANGSNITIDGLTLRNFYAIGVDIFGASPSSPAAGNTVTNCDIGFNTDLSWTTGAVYADGYVPNTTYTNNYVHDLTSMGLAMLAYGATDSIDGSLVANNFVERAVQQFSDGGAIYINMRAGHTDHVTVRNNFVRDYNGVGIRGGTGIYLDDNSSDVTVQGNIVGPAQTYADFVAGADAGAGYEFAFQVNDGHDNTVAGNLVDLGSTGQGWVYIVNVDTADPNFGQANNSFTGNIILSAFSGQENTGFYGQDFGAYAYFQGNTESAPPTIENNVYYNYDGGTETSAGVVFDYSTFAGSPGVSDSNPLIENPNIAGWDYAIAANSPVYNSPVSFPAIAGGWGPPGFTVPQTGAPPSCGP